MRAAIMSGALKVYLETIRCQVSEPCVCGVAGARTEPQSLASLTRSLLAMLVVCSMEACEVGVQNDA